MRRIPYTGLAIVAAILFVAASIWLVPSKASSSSFVLAKEHGSDAYLFMQMLARGAYDYYNVEKSHSNGVEQLVSAGYTPYELPNNFGFKLVAAGNHVSCTINSATYMYGEMRSDLTSAGMDVSTMDLPGFIDLPSDGDHPAMRIPSYSFDAQQYLPANYSQNELDETQRYIRLASYLAAATMEYLAVNNGMPGSINELEDFVGVSRNTAGWAGVNEVSSYSEVVQAEGNLFYGPKGDGTFTTAIQLGSDTYSYSWISGGNESRFSWTLKGRVLVYP